jgi:hypothetical protein
MSLGATVSQYHFTPVQSNAMSAPIAGQYFAEQDMVYTTDNASTKAHFGLSSIDQIQYDAANYYLFNPTLELGVDCGRLNEAAGRPNLNYVSQAGGGACYPASISATKAAKQLDAGYNSFAPSAEQIVLAEGDIRYAPARYVDQNNYVSPPLTDFTYQPRLMGTRDVVGPGCYASSMAQTQGNTSTCGLAGDPLPFPTSSDPRTSYGVDEPHSQYWSSLNLGGVFPQGCEPMADDYTLGTSECNLAQVQAGPPNIPPQYAMNLGMGGNGAMRFSQGKTKGRKGRGKK